MVVPWGFENWKDVSLIHFNRLLETHGLQERFFGVVNRILEEKGLLIPSSGLVHTVEATSASVHDKAVMRKLFHGKEKAKFGDKGYVGAAEKREARKSGVFWGVLDKGNVNHPLSSSQKRRNRKLSSVRAAVEHPFRVVKRRFGYVRVRYRGLRKNALHLNILFALANLYRIRRFLMPAT